MAEGIAERLAYRLRPLRDSGRFAAPLVDQFAAWVENAKEEELFRVNPLLFAERTGIGGKEATDLFVHAAHAGVFDFSWGVLCLDCGAFITTRGGLRAIGKKSLCRL